MAGLKALAGRFKSASGHHLHSTVSSSLRLGEAPMLLQIGRQSRMVDVKACPNPSTSGLNGIAIA